MLYQWATGVAQGETLDDITNTNRIRHSLNYKSWWLFIRESGVTVDEPWPHYDSTTAERAARRKLADEEWAARSSRSAVATPTITSTHHPPPTRSTLADVPSRLTTSNRDRSPSSSSSSSHSRSNGSRPLPDNPPSRMFTHNRLIHGPCGQTRITLKTQGCLLECPKCANSHASHPENDQ